MDTAPCPELAPALYVEYLDTSPLVQRRLLRPDEARPYSSLLPALMKVCEKQSLRIGTQGRVLLHAIPGAVAAYERAGLSSIGVERFEGMDYQLMRNAIGWKA